MSERRRKGGNGDGMAYSGGGAEGGGTPIMAGVPWTGQD